MTKDRLNDIWNGFSQRSSLDLSGTSVDDTPRPSREREASSSYADAMAHKPASGRQGEQASAPDPVAAALSAMHTEMQADAGRRKNRKSAPPAVSHSAPLESALERTLLADLAFTQSKTTRRGGDYLSYAAERQADWQRRKRKKFLGIF